jgi:hypothetical protein
VFTARYGLYLYMIIIRVNLSLHNVGLSQRSQQCSVQALFTFCNVTFFYDAPLGRISSPPVPNVPLLNC